MLSLKDYIAREEQIIMEEEERKEDLRNQVAEYFKTTSDIDDAKFHKFAEKIGADVHEAETIVYEMLSDFWQSGKYNKDPDIDIDSNELEMGIDVEMKHTSSPEIARKIALDHLAEMPDYYTRLKEMEAQVEQQEA